MDSPIDTYIAAYDGRNRLLLEELRDLVRDLAPDAGEKIAYGMPTFTLNGNLVHFAAFAHHIGFFPTPDGVEFARPHLGSLRHSKGGIQFPLDDDLPVELIRSVVTFRIAQQRAKRAR